MVERFWGRRGVYPADYADLVRPQEGGIRTGDLVSALEGRGMDVRVYEGDAPSALGRLEEGLPVLALIESGDVLYHYVVLTGVGPDHVLVHDPNHGPDRRYDLDRFMDLWAPTEHWAVVATPGGAWFDMEPSGGAVDRPSDDDAPLDDRLAVAVRLLEAGQSEEAMEVARRVLADALDLAERVESDAWRVLATARWLDGDADGALAAWNEAGEPRVDLIHLSGLESTRRPVVHEHLGLDYGRLLTPGDLARARRRLEQLPTVQLSQLAYQPAADGSVEVVGAVLEYPRFPGLLGLAGPAARGLFSGRTALAVGPLLGVGERWQAAAEWNEAEARAQLDVAAPVSDGVLRVSGGWLRERASIDGAPIVTARRLRGGLSWERWATGWLRTDVAGGLERWNGNERLGTLSVGAGLRHPGHERLHLDLGAEGWAGADRRVARLRARAKVEVPGLAPGEWRLVTGASHTSADAPVFLWEGAGPGGTRDPLLRSHPLVSDEAIDGPAFAPTLVHATIERTLTLRVGPLTATAGPFLDVVRITGAGPTRTFSDPGFEVRLGLFDRGLATALAHGADGWHLSVRATQSVRWPLAN